MPKYTYMFTEGNASMKNLLGGKGANLAEMSGLGLPVPKGFTITTEACLKYYDDGNIIGKEIEEQIHKTLTKIEECVGKRFGDPKNPLLLSVRSGARVSMPGMMDTILNLGMNDEVVKVVTEMSGNPQFAYDNYRRFIQMFGEVAMGIEKSKFEKIFCKVKEENSVEGDTDISTNDLKVVIQRYKELFKNEKGTEFPQEPREQLMEAVRAVFDSWNNPRAKAYRAMHRIPDTWGTAVNIQEMVFGNLGNDSGTGIAFTRDPSTGEKKLLGEFLLNAQGEDIVDGSRMPQSIEYLKELNPAVYHQFIHIAEEIEKHYKDMQDLEFTVEKGKLFILQTRNGRRTAAASVKIAVDLVNEGIIEQREALLRINLISSETLFYPVFDVQSMRKTFPIAKGLPGCKGIAVGQVFFDADRAVKAFHSGVKDIILFKKEMNARDLEAIYIAQGLLLQSRESEAFAIEHAKRYGKCCIVHCKDLEIDENRRYLTTPKGKLFAEGDWISIDGSTGSLYGEKLPMTNPAFNNELSVFQEWANATRKLSVRAIAENPYEAAKAIQLGAEGIGLYRTERTSFQPEKLSLMRQILFSDDERQKENACEELFILLKRDFENLFSYTKGYPVAVRLLSFPGYEYFLQDLGESCEVWANAARKNGTVQLAKKDHRSLKDGPWMDIIKTQLRAVIQVAYQRNKDEQNVDLKIIIPMLREVKELEYFRDISKKITKEIMRSNGTEFTCKIGAAVELPRAALLADEIAEEADVLCFDTNLLTASVFGFNDFTSERLLRDDFNPFEKLDQAGVGQLIQQAVLRGRNTKLDLELGVFGQQVDDPAALEFYQRAGINYVCCLPARIPIIRLMAAQVAAKVQE